ncbi:tetratricopeptide repeat protein [Novosphingobium sp. PY1]|uniref:tetratricopeptide repeat protein n=1 Tax=Novosphingobium sp. PY1 TaxID=1882221 RepID=UPI001A8DCBD3|nr:tetratricopeptide repeat protein [Novosphingobium sp. PY1]
MLSKTGTRIACVVLMAMSLSGCGRALEFFGLRHEAKPEVQVRTADADSAAAAVAEGRAHLAAGRTGQAIEQFQKALAAGDQIGPAANGMGVAYVRLGQFEQAHRFFSEALAVEPKNAMYQANMARLMRSTLLAERHEADFAAQVAARTLTGAHDIQLQEARPEVAAAEEPARQTAPSTSGATLQRISRGEVMIRSVQAESQAGRGSLPVVGVRGGKLDTFRPAVRIEFSDDGRKQDNAKDKAEGGKADASGGATDADTPKTARADRAGFKPLVRIDFPTSR